MKKTVPDLRSVHHPRHPGISVAVCESFSEAAEVCFARHHTSPEILLSIQCCGSVASAILLWDEPSEEAKRAWNNRDDATRDAAYIVSLAALESELGLVALSRAETRTGADYYVGQPNSLDLEAAYRLEVSGVDAGDQRIVRSRLREKLRQAAEGDSSLPAFASVVGFREAMILMEKVKEPR
jgi:hypothetical protein